MLEDIVKKVSSIRTPYGRVNELLKGILIPLQEFKKNVEEYELTKNENCRKMADENSTQVLADLKRIVDILKYQNDQTGLINIFIRMMEVVWNHRKRIRL
ncbi:MAG: hypothetical protein NTW30_00530 [Candidatus Aenigmarchaeota archaeon]|nr:hypothetical protein [Candidatus Aenigmarchaeota archaeon]